MPFAGAKTTPAIASMRKHFVPRDSWTAGTTAHEENAHGGGYQNQFEMQRASRRISVLMNQINMQRSKSRENGSDIESLPLANYKEITFFNLPAVAQTPNFQRYANTEEFDAFLLAALNYFKNFFKMKKIEAELEVEKESSGGISTFSSNARAYEGLKEEQVTRLHHLAQRYAFLLLRIGRSKCQLKDRFLFETLYNFTTYVVWLAFGRLDWYATSNELGRLMRTDLFNLNARVSLGEPEVVRNRKGPTGQRDAQDVPDRPGSRAETAKARDPNETNDAEPPRPTTSGRPATTAGERATSQTPGAERSASRRSTRSSPSPTMRKRPSVYATLNVRSPIIASLLPTPSESASWLFDRRRPLQRPSKKKQGSGRFVFAVNPDHFTDIGTSPNEPPPSSFMQMRERRNSRRASVIVFEEPPPITTAKSVSSDEEDSDVDDATSGASLQQANDSSRDHLFRRLSTTLKISSRPNSAGRSRPVSPKSSSPALPKLTVPE